MLLVAAFAIYVIFSKRLRISRSTTVTGDNARNFGITLLVVLTPLQVILSALLRFLLPESARVFPVPQILFVLAFGGVVLGLAFHFRDLQKAADAHAPRGPESP